MSPIFWPVTPAETAANSTYASGCVPVNFWYPPGRVDRYQTNSTPGMTDMTTGFQAAINQARCGGLAVEWGDTGKYVLGTGALDCTNAGTGGQSSITFRQINGSGIDSAAEQQSGILVTHNDYTVFDLTGTVNYVFENISVITNSSHYPKTCFLTARPTAALTTISPYFLNTRVWGYFSTAILYNYGAEGGHYIDCWWYNSAPDAGAKCAVFTGYNNILPGNGPGGIGFVSDYVTIISGSISTIDHTIIGGQFEVSTPSSTSDVFYLDGAQQSRFYGPWANCDGGRSYVYVDMTNTVSDHITLSQFEGENSTSGPAYGLCFSNTESASPSLYTLDDVHWEISSASIGIEGNGTNPTVIDNLFVRRLNEQTTRGILLATTVSNSTIDYPGVITVATLSQSVVIGFAVKWSLGTTSACALIDRAHGSLALSGALGINGNAVAAQSTGWGTPTSPAVQHNYSGSAATLAQTSAAVAEIITVLKNVGIMGA